MPNHTSAADIIAHLDLTPHPEGGYFRETFRDSAHVATKSNPERAASTAIYFLLEAGQISRWHTVDATETWHWYAGAPLRLSTAPDATGSISDAVLGPDLVNGQRPQAIVPAGVWQQAESLGAWTLVGCTVAPGFSFAGFWMAPEGVEPGR